jgi:hypothetical protein
MCLTAARPFAMPATNPTRERAIAVTTISTSVHNTVTVGSGGSSNTLTITASGGISFYNLTGDTTAVGATALIGTNAYILNNGSIQAQAGNNNVLQGGYGGDGVDLTGAASLLVNNGTIIGGHGATPVTDGFAGHGGIGVSLASGTLVTSGHITGGYGGGNGSEAIAAALGGAGAQLSSATGTNTGTITGGAGGTGAAAGETGGAGLILTGGGYFLNEGSIAGGQGGGGYHGGIGGAGVVISGGTLVNAGTISGGRGGYNYNGSVAGSGDAVQLTGAATLVVDPTAVFAGKVSADGTNDTLELAGTSPAALTGLGTEFSGFSTLSFAAGAAWTIDSSIAAIGALAAVTGASQQDTLVLTGAGDIATSLGAFGSVSIDGGNLDLAELNGVVQAPLLLNSSVLRIETGDEVAPAGAGEAAIDFQSGPNTLTNLGVVAGGLAAAGTIGGIGGAGVSGTYGQVTNDGAISGGAGGYGIVINGAAFGAGGTGGAGVSLAAGTITNLSGSTILGGAGGNLQPGMSGNAGAGGAGIVLSGNSSVVAALTNGAFASITGGAGGFAVTGASGNGGAGVSAVDATVVNAGTITGGSTTGPNASAGVGIYGNDVNLINSGTIAGGLNLAGQHANAVVFGNENSTLNIDPGAVFLGNVVANSSAHDILDLAGTGQGTLAGFGTQFTGFSTLDFSAGANWTVDSTLAALDGGQTIAGFSTGDTIVLTNFAATSESVGNTDLLLASGNTTYTLDISALSGEQLVVTAGSTETTITAANVTVQPTITGTEAGQQTNGAAQIALFAGTAITDANSFGSNTDTLTITYGGSGTLAGNGLSGTSGNYTLTGTAAQITSALDALEYSPPALIDAAGATTSFTLTLTDPAAGVSATDTATTLTAPINTIDTIPVSAVTLGSGGYASTVTIATAALAGAVVSTTVVSGAVLTVSPGSQDQSTTILAGGLETEEGSGSRAQVFGTLAVTGSGSETAATIENGGSATVSGAAGLMSKTVVSSGASLNAASGGFVSNTAVQGGGALTVSSGGNDLFTDVLAGGSETEGGAGSQAQVSGTLSVTNGGTMSAAVISSGGSATVSQGGSLVSATVQGGATLTVLGGAQDTDTTILAGGSETEDGQGVSALVSGTLTVSGGSVTGADIYQGGSVFVVGNSTMSGAVVSSGGSVTVSKGALLVNTTLQSGAVLTDTEQGVDEFTKVLSGGLLVVSGNPARGWGTALNPILSGGTIELDPEAFLDVTTSVSESVAGSDITGNGGVEVKGGALTLALSNGYSGETDLYGGTLSLQAKNGAGTGEIHFENGDDSTLVIKAGDQPGNEIFGFVAGDTIDLQGVGLVTASAPVPASQYVAFGGGGKPVETLRFNGGLLSNYVVHVSSDGAGGSDITVTAKPGVTVAGAARGDKDKIETRLTDTASGPGVLALDGNEGAVELLAANTYSGGTALDEGTLEIGAGATAGTGAITFGDPSAALQIDDSVSGVSSFANTLAGLAPGNSIDLTGVAYVQGATAVATADTLVLTDGGVTETFDLAAPLVGEAVAVSSDGSDGTLLTIIPAITIAGTQAGQLANGYAPVALFADAEVGDGSDGGANTDTLTITYSGGGTLSGTGISGTSGNYTLTGTAAQITAALDALAYTPPSLINPANATTTFTLTVSDPVAGTSATDTSTTLTAPINTIDSTVSNAVTLGNGTYSNTVTITGTGSVNEAAGDPTAIILTASTENLVNQGQIVGGGGVGGSDGEDGGDGGQGGNGAFLILGSIINEGVISGGQGGVGGESSDDPNTNGGNGGNGGAGMVLLSGASTNEGTVTGGQGGAGGHTGDAGGDIGGYGGSGGSGLLLSGGAFTNEGTVIGGDGGNGGSSVGGRDGANGSGGSGVSINGGTLVNAGTITGAGGADAVQFGSVAGTLVVDPTAVFNGLVVANTQADDVLELGVGNGNQGTLSGLGSQYADFSTFTEDSGANWLLAGSNNFGGTASIGGTLAIAGSFDLTSGSLSAANGISLSGSLTVDAGATLSASGYGATAVTASSGAYLLVDGSITGGSGSRQSGADGGTGASGISLSGGAMVTNDGTLTGGRGGSGPRNDGSGGAGISLSGGMATNDGTVTGGGGGGGYRYGGAGGAGIALSGGLATNDGTVTGGGGAAAGIDGGAGGAGILLSGGIATNDGTITGGTGGVGAISGGTGGAGISLSGGMAKNDGTVIGGQGGVAHGVLAEYNDGGTGGAGISLSGGGIVTNDGMVYGGYGGFGAYGGAGGAGVYIGGGTLINAGTIGGGFGSRGASSNGAAGDAVQFGSAAGTLVVDPTAVFIGNVVANDVNDVLVLGGTTVATLAGLGGQFTGFSTLDFSAVATWTVDSTVEALDNGQAIDGFANTDIIVLTDFAATTASFGSGGLVLGNASGSDTLGFALTAGEYLAVTASSTATTITADTGLAPSIVVTGNTHFATSNEATLNPFAGTAVIDPNLAGSVLDALTITLSGTGGTLTGAGLTGSGALYTLAGGAATIDSELAALVFKPAAGQPNSSNTTTFTLSDRSSASGTAATNSQITVTDTDPARASTFTGVPATVATTDEAPMDPFAGVSVSDPNAGTQLDAVIVSLTGGDADGTLSLAGGGLVKDQAGLYTLSATSPATLNQELKNLLFTPTAHQVAPGSSVATPFTLVLVNEAGFDTSASGTLTAKAVNDAPTIAGALSGQTTLDNAPLKPFATASITDPDLAVTDSLTITLKNTGGVATDADGTLSGAGLSKTGTYSLAATSPATLTAELEALVFTPTSRQVGGGGTVTTSFTLVASQTAGGSTVTTTNTATSVTVTAVNYINGPQYGDGTIEGTAGVDYITAYGYYNTIYDNGGNDVVYAGSGNATVNTSTGNVTVYLGSYYDTVSGGNGNTSVSGALGNTSVSLGNGSDSISVGGYFDTITLGNGTDTITGPAGNASVTIGTGSDSVTLGGYSNIVHAGSTVGTDIINAGLGLATVVGGNGNFAVTAGGTGDAITLGNGTDLVTGMQGLAKITTGSGNDTVVLAGYGSTVNAGGGTNNITGGLGNDTFFMPAAGSGIDTISHFSLTNGDILNLASALAATTWNFQSSTLGNYLKVSESGGNALIGIASTGTGAGTTIADLVGVSNLTLATLLPHTVL